MNDTTKIILGVGAVAVIAYLVTRPKVSPVVVRPVVPAQSALQQQAAAVNTTANTVAQAANSLSNLVNTISDAAGSNGNAGSSDTVDPNSTLYLSDGTTLSGVPWAGAF